MPFATTDTPPPPARPASSLVVPAYDVQWARPIFRAPSLPTQPQLYRDIPFTVLRLKPEVARARA